MPIEIEAFNKRWMENYHIEGFGIEGIRIHWPCPWCAASEWAETTMLSFQEEMMEEHCCSECGRCGRWDREISSGGSVIDFSFVATDGGELPQYVVEDVTLKLGDD